jgi:hypothetical protein
MPPPEAENESVVHRRTRDFDPVVDLLARHRGWLVAAYLLILALCIGAVLAFNVSVFPEMVDQMVSPATDFVDRPSSEYRWTILLPSVLGFFILQALFLWGGGRVQLTGATVRLRKLLLSLVIMAALMVLVSAGILVSLVEMVERFDSGDPTRWAAATVFSARYWLSLLIVSWSAWLLVGWLAVRRVDHRTGLSRLIAVVLTGSWIEFSIALPIELATRPRTKDCPCASGSWLTLLICIPLLVWSIGPALYLLYRREQRLTQADRRHPFKVLLRKSRRAQPPGFLPP